MNYVYAEKIVKSHYSSWIELLLTLSPWGIRHTNQNWGVSLRPCESEGRMEPLQYGWFQYMNFHFAKNSVVVTFAILYYPAAAEISVQSVHLVFSIYFIEKEWDICVWIVLNIYIFIEVKYCLGWSVKAFKKCMLMEMFISARRNIPLFVWLTVSFVVVPNEKGSMLIRENTAMFHLPPLLQ